MPHSVLSQPRQRPARGSSPGSDRAGAGGAADRRIALRLQRVARQVVLFEIGVEVVLGPVAQRVDLQAAVFDLEPRQVLARVRLEGLAPGNPAVEADCLARPAARPCGSRSSRRDRRTSAGRSRPSLPAPRDRACTTLAVGKAQQCDQRARDRPAFRRTSCSVSTKITGTSPDRPGRPGAAARALSVPKLETTRDAAQRVLGQHFAQHRRRVDAVEARVQRVGIGLREGGAGIDPVDLARSFSHAAALQIGRASVGGGLVDMVEPFQRRRAWRRLRRSAASGAKLSKPQRRM